MTDEETTAVVPMDESGANLVDRLKEATGFEVPVLEALPRGTRGFTISQLQFEALVNAKLGGISDLLALAAAGIPRKAYSTYLTRGNKDLNQDLNTPYAVFVRVISQATAIYGGWVVGRLNSRIRSDDMKAIAYALKHQVGYENPPVVNQEEQEKQADLLDDLFSTMPVETKDAI